jgi:hypothetical protein
MDFSDWKEYSNGPRHERALPNTNSAICLCSFRIRNQVFALQAITFNQIFQPHSIRIVEKYECLFKRIRILLSTSIYNQFLSLLLKMTVLIELRMLSPHIIQFMEGRTSGNWHFICQMYVAYVIYSGPSIRVHTGASVFNKIGRVLDTVMIGSNHWAVENIIRSFHRLPAIDRSVTTNTRSMIAFCFCAPHPRCSKHCLINTGDDSHFFLLPYVVYSGSIFFQKVIQLLTKLHS